jgi:uncharacterized protein YdhG (YjbR/CyaY superfamily)
MSSNDKVNVFLNEISNEKLRLKLYEIIEWIESNYSDFNLEYKWNQPMLVRNGTYIMGFSVSKKHIGVGLEALIMEHFKTSLEARNIEHGKMIFRIKEDDEVDYNLLSTIIDYIVIFKKDVKSFWL